MSERVVAVLGRGVVPAEDPVLRADDLGALRGDGIFETMHVRDSQPWLLAEHLDRMGRSASRLDLDLPDRDALSALVAAACAAWTAADEGALRLVCTRGPEQGGPVTVYATLTAVPENLRKGRRNGLAVLTASLGYAATARREAVAPWLLAGAKSLSYAVNMASLRWARRSGADDVLWTSADGYALEGPTSNLVWLDGTDLCTVPAADTGVLAGTTARFLLDGAGSLGFTAAERMVTPAQLYSMAGVWFTSSVRGCAEVRELDGIPLPPSPHTAAIHDLLAFPV